MGITFKRAREELDMVVEHRDRVDELLTEKVIQARHAGVSWQQVANSLGIDVKTARRRYLKVSG